MLMGVDDSELGNSETQSEATGRDGVGLALPPPHVRALLATDLENVDLSVRARNVLFCAGIKTFGDLIRWERDVLLATHACGKKTIGELSDLLEAHGLGFGAKIFGRLGAGIGNDPGREAEATRQVREIDEATLTKLRLRISEMNFSVRANDALTTNGVEFLGDLVVKSERDLLTLKNFGRKTLNEIKEKLARLDLHFGMDFPGWRRDEAKEIRETEDKDVNSPVACLRRQLTSVVGGDCLEEELAGILHSVAKERDAEIAYKLFGWSGKGQRTLESVGAEYDVTRERIRQIASKVAKKLGNNAFDAPWLDKALNLMRESCPATPDALADALRISGITKDSFEPTGLRTACEYLGRDFGLATTHVGSRKIYVKDENLSQIGGYFRLCRKLTANQGCANFESVCDELSVPEKERASFRQMATMEGTCEWLDDDKRWLYVPSLTRNRLSNFVAKVLSVAEEPSLSELRTALSRSRRLAFVPPAAVLGRFVEKQGLGTIFEGRVKAARDFSSAIEAGSVEAIMVSVFREHGPVLAWDRFRDLCLAAGMNPITFGIYLSASLILARLARGIYSLVGANVAPGLVEDVAAEIASTRKSVEWGWTARGTLWCAIPRIGANIGAGAVTIPTSISDIADGEWRPTFAGHEVEGVIKCSGRFLWGLKHPLSNSGMELDDTCILEFDLTKRVVNLTIGGEELVDMWESGDIELPVPDPEPDAADSEE